LRLGIVHESQVRTPPDSVDRSALELVHCPSYVAELLSGSLSAAKLRRIGLPWSNVLLQRTLAEVSGTLMTAELALKHGIACNTAGGTHHAGYDAGTGYCIVNDLAVTARSLLERKLASRVLICDLDVHYGDGTAALLTKEPRAFTLDVHCADNFPFVHGLASRDVPLAAGTDDDSYLRALSIALPEALDAFRPDIVLFDAGVDVHASDGLGKLALSDQGLLRRELCVLSSCLSRGVPVAGYVGGGYSRDLEALAARHCILHEAAALSWTDFKL
jgi:acetoin utilization deacetylase AcuC-like enzyme